MQNNFERNKYLNKCLSGPPQPHALHASHVRDSTPPSAPGARSTRIDSQDEGVEGCRNGQAAGVRLLDEPR